MPYVQHLIYKVYEGERPIAKDNKFLAQFELSGFPPMPKGRAQIEVTFDVDANGILSVSATETISRTAARITIQNADRLSDEAVDRMVREAETNRLADQEAVARIHAKNRLETYVYEIRRRMRDKVHPPI